MSIHVHKTGLNKTLGQQSDGIITSNLIGNFDPSNIGSDSNAWDNQVSGGNNIRRYNSISHVNSTPHHFSFDGSDDYLGEASTGYGGSAFNINCANAFTVSQWINTPSNGNYYSCIGSESDNEYVGLQFYPSTIYLAVFSSTYSSNSATYAPYNGTDVISAGAWHYVTLTHDGSGNYKVYINGTIQNDGQTPLSTSFSLGRTAANSALTLGRSYDSSPYYSTNGVKLGHVHVHTSELKNSQVRQNFLASHDMHNNRVYGATYTA
tara:strand:- start:1441 stop:2232 length:792 start_codon:yes stop_codon:yes gene_type:complete